MLFSRLFLCGLLLVFQFRVAMKISSLQLALTSALNNTAMVNELTETETPQLSPPTDTNSVFNDKINNNEEFQTPESVSSSIEDYSPVIPSIAQVEKYTNDISKSETEVVVASKTKTIIDDDDDIFNDNDDENGAAFDDIKYTNSNSSIKTFSSDEEDVNERSINNGAKITGNTEDDELFEHFNGSTKDLASPTHKRAIELGYGNSTASPIQMDKIRNNNKDKNIESLVNQTNNLSIDDGDLKNDLRYKNLSRNITPFNPKDGNSDRAMMSRIQELENESKELDTKYFKLEREIVYVDKMLEELKYNKFEVESKQPVEIRKLLYAKGKLEDRLQDAKKSRYDIGVTLIKLRRNVYGDNSGDMTGYFARNVSS